MGTAYIEAYGCTLNFGEAREIEDMLVGQGWRIVSSPAECDLAVIVTCVVIETTERAMLKRVRDLSTCPSLVITGCMATACRDKAERLAPKAVFVPPGDIDALSLTVGAGSGRTVGSPPEDRSYVIVPIATGCLGECAYCITRLARGRLRSRSPDAIISAVRKAAASGPREIQLTAQDTAAYGLDASTDLPQLVTRVCSVEGDFRLRVGMMNPKNAMRIVDGLARMYAEPKVFKFLHLPVQSASDRLLLDMNRGYSVNDFRAIVSRIRKDVPEITLSTDLIVGYPGESEDDHCCNLAMISEVRPDIVNVTRFSARPGTPAAESGGQVVGWRAKERSRELTKLRFSVALERNRAFVGKCVRALATEKGKSDSTIFRTDEYKQVVVQGSHELGVFRALTIEDATNTYLIGAVSEETTATRNR